jgi:hypothetical protein
LNIRFLFFLFRMEADSRLCRRALWDSSFPPSDNPRQPPGLQPRRRPEPLQPSPRLKHRSPPPPNQPRHNHQPTPPNQPRHSHKPHPRSIWLHPPLEPQLVLRRRGTRHVQWHHVQVSSSAPSAIDVESGCCAGSLATCQLTGFIFLDCVYVVFVCSWCCIWLSGDVLECGLSKRL